VNFVYANSTFFSGNGWQDMRRSRPAAHKGTGSGIDASAQWLMLTPAAGHGAKLQQSL
jgi:hypothetical protein